MEDISILIPIYNRSKWLPLIVLNLKQQDYPHNKLHVYIDDDSNTDLLFKTPEELQEIKQILHPIKLTYTINKNKRSIGRKRNELIKNCNTKIFCFLDSDDIYHSTYISHSYNLLKEKKVGCVGSDKMVFCMTDKDFALHAINCGDRAVMIHEACIMATKKWFKASCKFGNHSMGEGKNLFVGHENNVAISDIMKVMCCVQHSENTIDKLQFAKEENKLDLEISDEYKKILTKILEL